MSGYVNLDEEFTSTIARDVMRMLLGDRIGVGQFRDVYAHATDPTLVVKLENGWRDFSNIREWDIWQAVKEMDLKKWFAPVESIAPCGSVLVMKRCQPARREELPERVPAFFTDFKPENWGLYDGRVVCMDYGNHLMLENGMTKRMRKARWH